MKTIFKFIGWLFGLVIFAAFVTLNFVVFDIGILDWSPEWKGVWIVLGVIIIDIYYIWNEWKSFRGKK